MQCPIDGTQLVMADRNGVEIDYCPQCRGVWLDRGELDKIIERSGAYTAQPVAYEEVYEDEPSSTETPRKKKKRKGGALDFLEDIFDF